MRRVLIATSNPGKLRDFAGAAQVHGIEIAALPRFASLPTPVEDGKTFETGIAQAMVAILASPRFLFREAYSLCKQMPNDLDGVLGDQPGCS